MAELNTGNVQTEPEDGNEPGAALQIAEYIASKEANGVVFEQDDRDMVAFLWESSTDTGRADIFVKRLPRSDGSPVINAALSDSIQVMANAMMQQSRESSDQKRQLAELVKALYYKDTGSGKRALRNVDRQKAELRPRQCRKCKRKWLRHEFDQAEGRMCAVCMHADCRAVTRS